ncbi:hypothetical protein [Streptomyces fuscichromogenes]|uniref:Crocagin biosynthetic protein CgnE/B domain-containing protein n=1 Tax=Streptomyces fuscichromogenes TaxID=1324013 RepID=A0A917XAM5_9ACTN|nr:hypothetical protein [Streptomyces fuscichromogenes]GGN00535.1 hypothetical protein GCM10011578_022270 [Streptomyces fuscichromogenes]
MRDGMLAGLGVVFTGQEATVRTDEPGLANWLTVQGVPASMFEGVLSGREPAPSRAVAVPLDHGRLPSRRVLRDIFSRSSVLWIPLASLSTDPQVSRYGLEKFSEIDIRGCVAANRRIISQLRLARAEVHMTGPGTDLTIRLPEQLRLSSRTRPELLPDEHSTIGNYFEVAMSPTDPAGRVDTDLTVSGKLRTDSVLVARHRELTGARAGRFGAAAELAEKMRKCCPLYAWIRGNRFVDGFGPFTAGIHAASGPEYRGAVTEVAVGTGVLSADRVDWSLNCLLNEGAAGVRLGWATV